ncbi:MAG: peptidoglycan DD-metalloendopeptidase family protein [Methylovirgula sp.]
MPTGSIAQRDRAQPVQARPLPPLGATSPGPVAAYTAPSHPNPRLASAQSYGNPVTTGSIGRPGAVVAGWTAEGGMPVVVALGESADIIAKRYGIPEEALLRTNGFRSAAQVRPGTRLVIPVYNAALAASSGVHVGGRREAAARLKFVKGPQPADRRHATLARAETGHRHAEEKHERSAKLERHDKHAERKLAKEDHAARKEHAERKVAKEEHAAAERLAEVHARAEAHARAEVHEHEKIASLAPEHRAVVTQKPVVDPTPTASLQEVSTGKSVVAAAVPEFRWPAHGRIIRGFQIGRNDGINIALPEGTSVHAAEAGVVAYAGNQLKGYGNLILIRHPNGFITAYANNSKIDVTRGEAVKRGQVIAKSGQSGNVATPQLHFELRKGSKPVDPTQYLAGL